MELDITPVELVAHALERIGPEGGWENPRRHRLALYAARRPGEPLGARTVGTELGMSPATVLAHLEALVDARVLERVIDGAGSRGSAYVTNLDFRFWRVPWVVPVAEVVTDLLVFTHGSRANLNCARAHDRALVEIAFTHGSRANRRSGPSERGLRITLGSRATDTVVFTPGSRANDALASEAVFSSPSMTSPPPAAGTTSSQQGDLVAAGLADDHPDVLAVKWPLLNRASDARGFLAGKALAMVKAAVVRHGRQQVLELLDQAPPGAGVMTLAQWVLDPPPADVLEQVRTGQDQPGGEVIDLGAPVGPAYEPWDPEAYQAAAAAEDAEIHARWEAQEAAAAGGMMNGQEA